MARHGEARPDDDHTVLVILRDAGEQAGAAVERLSAAWARSHPALPLLLGWATHCPPAFPNDTLDQARQHMAPVRARPVSSPWDATPWAG